MGEFSGFGVMASKESQEVTQIDMFLILLYNALIVYNTRIYTIFMRLRVLTV